MKLYDREIETKVLSHLLSGHEPRSICVLGDSGVGKSVLVEKCLAATDMRVITFSFKAQVDAGAASLTTFLLGLNRTYSGSLIERFTNLKAKDVKLNFPGFSVTYDVKPEALDIIFFEYMFEKLRRAGYHSLRIENIELCKNACDIHAILKISQMSCPSIKIIYEIGTLAVPDPRLRSVETLDGHRHIFKLAHLDEGKTIGLYRFLHGDEPPPEIFKKTNGLPLAVRHRVSIPHDDSGLTWIERKLETLDSSTYQLAYALSTLDEPCAATDLEHVFSGTDFPTFLLSAVRHDVINEETCGLKFTHPSFRVVLQRKPIPYLDRTILAKTLVYRIARSNGAPEHELPLISIAQRLGDHATVRQRAFNLLPGAYSSQNAPLLRYLCDVLLNGDSLSPRQSRILLMLKVLSLCGLSMPDKAADILSKNAVIFESDKRSAVLRAMVAYQRNQFIRSNEIIVSALEEGLLDDRSIAITLSIRVANDIPLGNAAGALTAFEDALALAQAMQMDDLHEEFARLHARLTLDPLLAIERMRDFVSFYGFGSANEIARARLLHNLGVLEMVTSDGADGIEHLKQARSVFTQYGLNYAAYSAVTQAVAEVAAGRIEDALSLLADAKCLCREQYDLCSVINNYAACLLLVGEYESCFYELKKMEEMMSSPQPLNDSILLSALRENRAVAHLKLRDFSSAFTEISRIPTIKFPSFERERNARTHRIRQAIEKNDAAFPLVNETYDRGALPYNKFNVVFVTLSFFDYPFSLLPPEEIASISDAVH